MAPADMPRQVPPPNQPATPNRTVRIPDELWEPALAKAQEEGTTVTAVIIDALKRYLRDY